MVQEMRRLSADGSPWNPKGLTHTFVQNILLQDRMFSNHTSSFLLTASSLSMLYIGE